MFSGGSGLGSEQAQQMRLSETNMEFTPPPASLSPLGRLTRGKRNVSEPYSSMLIELGRRARTNLIRTVKLQLLLSYHLQIILCSHHPFLESRKVQRSGFVRPTERLLQDV